MRALRLLALFAAVSIAATRQAIAQTPATSQPPRWAFDSSEAMIPMRDGVMLHTLIYAPKGLNTNLPLILTRTPYGATTYARLIPVWYSEFADEGYTLVFQDIRGRFVSEGQFEELRGPSRDDP